MKKLKLFIIMPLVVLLLSADNGQPTVESIAKGNTEFSIDLYNELRSKEGNIFFSPFSISTALAMTYAGAAAQTESQMAKVLHFAPNTPQFHSAYKAYLDQIKSNYGEGIKLNIANKLWGQKDFVFSDSYMKLTKENYDAAAENLDFIANPEKSLLTINKWIETETKEKIKDLLIPGAITPDTKLILTNAIYFKGEWENVFDRNMTRDKEFNMDDKSKIKVPFMNQTTQVGYVDKGLFTAVQFLYKGNRQSMIIILPKEASGLEKTEKELTAENFNKLKAEFKWDKVSLSIPKFKTTFNLSLKDKLSEMGMPAAFNETADFSLMAEKPLQISNVIHKAVVEINEEGTEAAAATTVGMVYITSANQEKVLSFVADHPFLFLIVDHSTGNILFMGRIMDPSK